MPTPFTIYVQPGEQAIARAIAQLPQEENTPARIVLAPGIYREKVELRRANTTLEGNAAADTHIVWGDAATDLMPDGSKRGTFRTATLFTDGEHITLRNLTIENDAAPRERAGQTVALYADGDFFTCEDCVLKSHQDTLFTAPLPPTEIQKDGFIGPKQHAPRTPQRHLYLRCEIRGDIDFIFGGAAAWFERCDIVSVDGRADQSAPCAGYATAASTPQGQRFGYVFSHCRFLGEGVAQGCIYLGRPWREWARTVLLFCELGEHIHPAGFDDWNKPHAHETIFYAEYGCTGPGAAGKRAPFVRALTQQEADAMTQEAFFTALGGA